MSTRSSDNSIRVVFAAHIPVSLVTCISRENISLILVQALRTHFARVFKSAAGYDLFIPLNVFFQLSVPSLPKSALPHSGDSSLFSVNLHFSASDCELAKPLSDVICLECRRLTQASAGQDGDRVVCGDREGEREKKRRKDPASVTTRFSDPHSALEVLVAEKDDRLEPDEQHALRTEVELLSPLHETWLHFYRLTAYIRLKIPAATVCGY